MTYKNISNLDKIIKHKRVRLIKKDICNLSSIIKLKRN